MRKFINKLFIFCFTLMLISGLALLYAEFAVSNYASIFQLKTDYFNENKKNINTLVLGSSHNKMAINPELIKSFKCANLAYGGQDIKIDSALLKTVIKQLPKLKFVILELSYQTLEQRFNPNYHRNSLYLRAYDINLFNRSTKLIDYSIYLSNPKLYNQFLNPFVSNTPLNEFGFETKVALNENRFKDLNYNENLIWNDSNNIFIKRHKYEDVKTYFINSSTLTSMVEICIQKNVVPIILSPPVYNSYYNSYLPQKEHRRVNYINNLLKTYPSIVYLNYENHNDFNVYDFKNEDHLNPKGAEKFSILLNKKLLEIKKAS